MKNQTGKSRDFSKYPGPKLNRDPRIQTLLQNTSADEYRSWRECFRDVYTVREDMDLINEHSGGREPFLKLLPS